ncbi:hypothetical protein QYF61_027327 [Mycteria americana]|uniref:Uncharacterized protein n=1 Tax=Mycteria americana TaxID=33587 RepID=A0AAN7RKX5_MYCAM|nr:hypothetical protein QYF61_027327 [Mycteria americana]
MRWFSEYWDSSSAGPKYQIRLKASAFIIALPGETQITAMCWGLAHAYRALFNTIQNPQGEEKFSGSEDKTTGTMATPTSATDTAITPTPVTGTAAEPGNQPVPVSVAPIHKKKSWRQKSAHLEREDEKAGPSRGEEEEEEELINETETT